MYNTNQLKGTVYINVYKGSRLKNGGVKLIGALGTN